jgi:hypothetical protein
MRGGTLLWENIDRTIVQADRSKWDHRHQVLGTKHCDLGTSS